jgi:small subunit ribosomal protein S10
MTAESSSDAKHAAADEPRAAGRTTAAEPTATGEETKQKIRIKIKAYDYKLVDQSARQIVDTIARSGARVYGPVPLPTERKRYTVNRSTFVHKNARDQYEIRVHKRLIDISDWNPKTVDALQSLQLPAGVDVSMK